MNKFLDDYFKMINASSDCITKFILVWDPNAVMQELSDDLVQSRVYTHSLLMIQMRGSSDETLIKNERRDELNISLIQGKNSIVSYSNHTKDRVGFMAINKSNSDIKALKDEEVSVYADLMNALTVSLGVKLDPYNFKAADRLVLKTRMDIYAGVLGGTRDAMTSVVTATANIAKERERIMNRLRNEADPLIETFIEISPVFVSEFKSSRKVVHYGTRHENPECTINISAKDAVTSDDLSLVLIEVVETTDKALTDNTGAAELHLALAGTYSLRCTKTGYAVFLQPNVVLGVGDVLNLNILLDPLV